MNKFDRFQVQRLLDLIDFYRERGWEPHLVIEFLILDWTGNLPVRR